MVKKISGGGEPKESTVRHENLLVVGGKKRFNLAFRLPAV
jgi:hypothetical protein